MRTTPRTEDEAKRASSRTLFKPGWRLARINEGGERPDRFGNDMIELLVSVPDGQGGERLIKDWLFSTDRGAAKLRHCCEAVGALDAYERGEISQEDFPGHDVEVKLGIEKKRGFPDRNIIEDYRPAASAVVQLRPAS
jgi:hypothetical protein